MEEVQADLNPQQRKIFYTVRLKSTEISQNISNYGQKLTDNQVKSMAAQTATIYGMLQQLFEELKMGFMYEAVKVLMQNMKSLFALVLDRNGAMQKNFQIQNKERQFICKTSEQPLINLQQNEQAKGSKTIKMGGIVLYNQNHARYVQDHRVLDQIKIQKQKRLHRKRLDILRQSIFDQLNHQTDVQIDPAKNDQISKYIIQTKKRNSVFNYVSYQKEINQIVDFFQNSQNEATNFLRRKMQMIPQNQTFSFADIQRDILNKQASLKNQVLNKMKGFMDKCKTRDSKIQSYVATKEAYLKQLSEWKGVQVQTQTTFVFQQYQKQYDCLKRQIEIRQIALQTLKNEELRYSENENNYIQKIMISTKLIQKLKTQINQMESEIKSLKKCLRQQKIKRVVGNSHESHQKMQKHYTDQMQSQKQKFKNDKNGQSFKEKSLNATISKVMSTAFQKTNGGAGKSMLVRLSNQISYQQIHALQNLQQSKSGFGKTAFFSGEEKIQKSFRNNDFNKTVGFDLSRGQIDQRDETIFQNEKSNENAKQETSQAFQVQRLAEALKRKQLKKKLLEKNKGLKRNSGLWASQQNKNQTQYKKNAESQSTKNRNESKNVQETCIQRQKEMDHLTVPFQEDSNRSFRSQLNQQLYHQQSTNNKQDLKIKEIQTNKSPQRKNYQQIINGVQINKRMLSSSKNKQKIQNFKQMHNKSIYQQSKIKKNYHLQQKIKVQQRSQSNHKQFRQNVQKIQKKEQHQKIYQKNMQNSHKDNKNQNLSRHFESYNRANKKFIPTAVTQADDIQKKNIRNSQNQKSIFTKQSQKHMQTRARPNLQYQKLYNFQINPQYSVPIVSPKDCVIIRQPRLSIQSKQKTSQYSIKQQLPEITINKGAASAKNKMQVINFSKIRQVDSKKSLHKINSNNTVLSKGIKNAISTQPCQISSSKQRTKQKGIQVLNDLFAVKQNESSSNVEEFQKYKSKLMKSYKSDLIDDKNIQEIVKVMQSRLKIAQCLQHHSFNSINTNNYQKIRQAPENSSCRKNNPPIGPWAQYQDNKLSKGHHKNSLSDLTQMYQQNQKFQQQIQQMIQYQTFSNNFSQKFVSLHKKCKEGPMCSHIQKYLLNLMRIIDQKRANQKVPMVLHIQNIGKTNHVQDDSSTAIKNPKKSLKQCLSNGKTYSRHKDGLVKKNRGSLIFTSPFLQGMDLTLPLLQTPKNPSVHIARRIK